jgi:hypothetical protein
MQKRTVRQLKRRKKILLALREELRLRSPRRIAPKSEFQFAASELRLASTHQRSASTLLLFLSASGKQYFFLCLALTSSLSLDTPSGSRFDIVTSTLIAHFKPFERRQKRWMHLDRQAPTLHSRVGCGNAARLFCAFSGDNQEAYERLVARDRSR